ncbi:MAG: glycosyltransferase family 2 protein [Chloroflexota bacterium]
MIDSLRVSVVMPAYNEEAVIGAILDRLHALNVVDEIIVVDDGSKDKTPQVAATYESVRVVRHPYNMGNGAAVKSGIRAATGDVIILMDSDGQHPPEEIPKLLQHLGEYDMVVGARSSESEAQQHRRIANSVFNWYASYIVGYPVPDLTSGFRAMRASIAKNFLYLLPNKFSYPTTLTIAFFRAGYAVKYQPFVSPARVGTSKIRPFRDGLRFLLTITRLAVLFVPLKIFIPVSLFLTISGGGYVISQLILDRRFSGFGGLITTVGIFTFMLGLVSEQIALLRLVNSER